MAIDDAVLIDTCIWEAYFRNSPSSEKSAVDDLIDDDRAALIGPILAETLLGYRRDEHADWIGSVLESLHYLNVTWMDWNAAAKLGRRLAANGHSLPLTDLAIAAVALNKDLAVYSTDPHFDLIAGLKHHTP
ncbi:MAG: PIN domain-containing protein [Tepidisphaerales bacterium]